ncbi:helix-turn-helix transcriptional regulator [Allonocardiopsis opalescens]|uniref:Regulatory LuxR family protein n=1 Tax=Allonocardiopsis opalescens TaxID=1144618 RepID=A0A2T0QBU6_9ACTN|nr:LuxR family transcriptional regulator [Allonocardiopsis opalescens]PRY01426.1 regulatory LuxR family protein [Allonocardiopsis opalescens]
MSADWPFVGRTAALSRVVEALTAEPGGGAVVAGAAGVGKSRLVREALALAGPARFLVRRAMADPGTASVPFGALSGLLPADLPALTGGNPLRAAAEALLDPVDPRPLLVEADDAHLLDGHSAALLGQLVRTGRARLLGTVRTGEPVAESLAALWRDGPVARVELGPLTREEMERVLAAALDAPVDSATRARLWRTTLGNPLFLRETVAAGRESGALRRHGGGWGWDGPWALAPRLLELIGARLDRLEGAERHALELLACAGTVGLALLERAVPPEAVERLEVQGLVWVDRGERGEEDRRVEVRLGHPLHAEAIRATMPVTRGRARRRELAELVEGLGARRRDDALRVALWRLDSGGAVDPGLMLRAARHAWTGFDLRLTQRLARAAVQAGGGDEAVRLLADAHVAAAQEREAESALDLLSAEPASQQEWAAGVAARASNLFYGLDRPAEALDLLDAVVPAATAPDARELLRMLHGTVLVLTGQTRRGLEVLDGLLAGEPGAEHAAHAHLAGAFAHACRGRPAAALAAAGRGRELVASGRAASPWLDGTLRMAEYYTHVLAGDLPEAAAVAEGVRQGVEAAGPGGSELLAVASCFMSGQLARLRGRAAEAVRTLGEGRALGAAQPGLGFLVNAELAHAAALAGDHALAGRALADARAARRRGLDLFTLWGELAGTWVLAMGGDTAAGVDHALDCAARAQAEGAVGYELIALHDVVRLGRPRLVADRLAAAAAGVGGAPARLYAEHARAAADRDGAGLDRVAAAFEKLGADLPAAEAAARASAAHRLAGRQGAARASAARAALAAGRCPGVDTPALAALRAPELTRRELEIARLAAAGLRTTEIAERLGLAARTVDNHLHRAYAKLGAKGRQDLSALLGGPGGAAGPSEADASGR